MEPNLPTPKLLHSSIETSQILDILRDHWTHIQTDLIRRVDSDYGIYDGTTFKRDRFADWLAESGTPWPRLLTGVLALDDGARRWRRRVNARPLGVPFGPAIAEWQTNSSLHGPVPPCQNPT